MHLSVANVVSTSAVLWHAGSIPGKSCVNDRNLSRQVSLHIMPGGGGEDRETREATSPVSPAHWWSNLAHQVFGHYMTQKHVDYSSQRQSQLTSLFLPADQAISSSDWFSHS